MNRLAESKQGNIYDAFVKSLFGRVVVFADFLRHYGNKKFVAEVNLSKIRLAPTHYLGKDGDERIVDLVFQCPLKHGEGELTAAVVFEHQSGSLNKIPAKLLKYISAIWDAEIKEGKKVLSAPYFIVLRTGKRPLKGQKPKMADFVAKSRNGTPFGMHVPSEFPFSTAADRFFDYEIHRIRKTRNWKSVSSVILRVPWLTSLTNMVRRRKIMHIGAIFRQLVLFCTICFLA